MVLLQIIYIRRNQSVMKIKAKYKIGYFGTIAEWFDFDLLLKSLDNYPNLEYYSSIYDRFKEDYHIHMNDENFEEVNEIVFPTPSKVAKVLKIDENFPIGQTSEDDQVRSYWPNP